MKKNLLKSTLLTAALAVSAGAWAQTDVTSTYITNADFSSTDGWTEDVSVQYKDFGSGLIGTYGVRTAEGQAVSTVDDTHLATEYCFGFEARWQTNYASYNQETKELPVGAYTLTFDVENTNPNTTKATYNNLFYVQVGETKYTDSSTEWMNGKSSWTTHTILFNITEASTATISLGYGTGGNNFGSKNTPTLHVSHLKLTWTDPLVAAKADLQAEIDKAKATDATALATAIAAAEQALTTATTQAALLEALNALKAAEEAYANEKIIAENAAKVEGASAENPIVTPFVVNGTFTDNVSGWTCTGGFQNQAKATNQQGDFTVPFFENWNGAAKVNKMFQTIKNIPNGTYKLKIAAFVNTLDDPNDSQFVFANDDKVYLTTGTPTFYEVWMVLTTNNMEIGLEQTEAIANWMGIDNVTLTYYGEGDVIEAAKVAAPKANWNEALAAAKAALADEANKNVTGNEKTALEAEIAKAEPTTAEGYDEATAALNTAKNTFAAAAASYNAFADAVATADVTLPYADPNLKPGTDLYEPKTATEAQSYASEIYTALRKYYESNAKAEAVTTAVDFNTAVAAANADVNTGWTPAIGTNKGQGYTDSEGNVAALYLDGGWASNAGCNIDIKRNIEVPAGEYLLTVKARGAISLDTYTMTVAGKSVELPHISNTGGVFGNGWNDAYVVFESEGEAVELNIVAKSTAVQQWISLNDFRLVQLKEIEVPMASAAELVSLQNFVNAAAALTLGFDANEYAPYTNAKGLQLAETVSKALQNENGITKKAYDELASQVAAIQWVKNTTVMQPIYNGEFAEVTPGQNYPLGWVRTNGWGNMQSGIAGDFATAYYNQPGALRYGSTTGYNLPLKTNTKYTLTVFYRSHEDNSNSKLTTTVYLLGGETIDNIEFEGNPSKTEWKEATMAFTTTDAGNYLIELANDGNTWMTGVKLTDATTTGISTVSSERNTDALYNLQGQRVMKGQKGLFIQNGKKFFVK